MHQESLVYLIAVIFRKYFLLQRLLSKRCFDHWEYC